MTAEKQKTDNVQVEKEHGQNKCPKCGSTEISHIPQSDNLRCEFCRHEFSAKKVSSTNIKELKGTVISSGASDIQADASDIITLKCQSCGAEVVIDTNEALQSTCHWCRNVLSLNSKVPNGAVPDVVLPFFISKDDAQKTISEFVNSRKFYANSKFKKEFTIENIKGVYFPYMIVDVNAHCHFSGEGEHQTDEYQVKVNDNFSKTLYDADVYHVEREFDITIDDLTIESNKDKLDVSGTTNTNNVINAIMPFDIVNAVKWDANYLKGYTSEKRDVNVSELDPLVRTQSVDVAKFACNESLKFYDRGVCWNEQNIDIKGQEWKAALLPVWLYSYLEVKGNKKLLHYVAVNARTKEVMGSVPINMGKLLLVSLIIEILCIFAVFYIESDSIYELILLTPGVIYYFLMYSRYRNKDARHKYELETTNNIENLVGSDDKFTSRKGLSSSRIAGCNNTTVSGVNNGLSLEDMVNKIK